MLRVRWWLLTVLILGFTAACGAATQTEATEAPVVAGGPETRPEILALAGLPVEGGGTFEADSVANQNVLLWFWGPH